MLKPTLARHFALYDQFHRHPTNLLCHKIGMPLIVFNAVALFDWVLLGGIAGREVTLAHVLFVAVIGWYLTLDKKLAAVMVLWYGACIPLGWIAPWPVIIGAGVIGWIVQLLGHLVWEKRSPAFLTNLTQALIGPLYFAARLTGDWPQKPAVVR
jgi:uncharacterized membrane protein YGL010W